MISIPETDTDFEDVTIDRVEKHGDGWTICHGAICFGGVPGDTPVEPQPGMMARFYGGAGAGCGVRGLVLNGTPIFYRTAEQDDERMDVELFGKDCSDLLARWDRGDPIHTIEMGGIGPGYEQALQITAMEMLRHLVELSPAPDPTMWKHKEEWDVVRKDLDASVSPRTAYLGLTGAQWGAAMSLATTLYVRGPRDVMRDPQLKERHIMVSREMPQAPPSDDDKAVHITEQSR